MMHNEQWTRADRWSHKDMMNDVEVVNFLGQKQLLGKEIRPC